MPDPCAVVARLPRGLCGVVFREAPDRIGLGVKLAKLCRERRIALVVAGDARLAARLHAGVHLRGGRRTALWRQPGHRLITSSVHNHAELHRARRAGAAVLFISPVFATASHPGGRVLGVSGFARLARAAGPAKPMALGGIDGKTVRALGKICAGLGAIDAFLRKT